LIKPNLFIVGQPRTGTHALHDLLNQHPQIYMSSPKEPVYFAKGLHKESDLFHKKQKYFHFRAEKKYLKLFKKCSKERFVGESTSIYLLSKEAAAQIQRFNPDAKIIMMFREPVSWLRSYHSEAYHSLGEDQAELKDALLKEEVRKKWECLTPRVPAPSLLFYSEFLQYTHHAQRYLKIFKQENIKIIIYDDFRNDNIKIYNDTLQFLGLDQNFDPEIKQINVSKTRAMFPRLQYVIQSPHIQKIAMRVFPDAIYRKIVRFYWEKLFLFEKRPDICPQFTKELMQKFKAEVESLSKLINRDLVQLWG